MAETTEKPLPRITEHTSIPAEYLDMFERAMYPHLTTLLPDGSPRCSPQWCDYDGTYLRFTAETTHIVYQTVTTMKKIVLSIHDVEVPMRYLEVRGVFDHAVPDPTAAHLYHLNRFYKYKLSNPLPTADKRVILYVKPELITCFPGRPDLV